MSSLGRLGRRSEVRKLNMSFGDRTLQKIGNVDNNGEYRISLKSCRSEILFQGLFWCDNNSRAVSTKINKQAALKSALQPYNASAHMYYSSQPFTKRQDFEGGDNSRCGDILRKCGSNDRVLPTLVGSSRPQPPLSLFYHHSSLK